MPRRLPKHCIEDKDRHGNIRYYVRIRGKLTKKIRITGVPWTQEFMAQYELALNGEPVVTKSSKSVLGTWRWLCEEYFGSVDFKRLKERTQRVRRQILESTFDEPIKTGSPLVFANCPIAKMTTKAIKVLRDRKAQFPEAANGRLKAIRAVFLWAREEHDNLVDRDPSREAKYFKVGSEGFHTWTSEDIQQYLKRHEAGSKARLALCVLLFTGMRRGNAVLLGRQHVQNGKIRFEIQKRRATDDPKWLTIPMLPTLQAEIDRAPKSSLTFLTTAFGKPFTSNGFGNWFRKRCQEAGITEGSAHGLRKAGAVFAAENGATDAQLQAIYGWETAKEAARYRKMAQQKLLAADAMCLIRLPSGGDDSVSLD